MSILKRLCVLVGLASIGTLPAAALAEPHACTDCGAETGCRPVCRCVPTTEEKSKLCFDCKCEQFCVPGPSCLRGRNCEAMQVPGGECAGADHCCLGWNIWKPGGAQVRTRRVLIVHEVKKEVPSYKWEVEYLCDACCRRCVDAMPLRPGASDEIRPVSNETPIATADEDTSPARKPVKNNWWAQLFGEK